MMAGQGGAAHGTPARGPARLTLVHGFLGSPEDWDEVCALLPAGTVCDRVALADLGCGSVAEAATALAARLERTPCDALVGYSMGGRIVLELASTRPALVPRLVMLAGSPGLDDPDERARRAAEDDARAAAIARDGLDAFVEHWYRLPIFAPFRAHPSFATVRARRAAGDAAFWARCVAGCSPGRGAPRWDALPALAARTTFAAGELDDRYASYARRAQQLAPAMAVAVQPGVGHVLPLEAPAFCARLIERSLASRPA